MHLHNVIIVVGVSWLLSILNGSTDATVIGISLEAFIVTTPYTTTATTATSTESNTTTIETRYISSSVHNSSVPGKETQNKGNNTVPGDMERMTKIVAVAVSSLAFLVAVASVVTCWKKKYLCFKLHPKRNQEGAGKNEKDDQDSMETGKNSQAFPTTNPIFNTPTGQLFPPSVPPGWSYLNRDKPSSSEQNKVQEDGSIKHIRPHNISNGDTKNGNGGRKKKKRKKDKKGRRVHPADEHEEIEVNNVTGPLHRDDSRNEMHQEKKKKKKKKKERKHHVEEPNDTSAVPDKNVVSQSQLGERENSGDYKCDVASASKVELTNLRVQDDTASNVNTSEDRNKGTQDEERIHQKEKKKKWKGKRELAQERVENTVDTMNDIRPETPAIDAEHEDTIREKVKKKHKRKKIKKKRDDDNAVHESPELLENGMNGTIAV